jgi:ABC-type hemin transport system substrate-binding protein
MATQPAKVNRALAKADIKVEIVRGNGYYWFDDATTQIRSLYQCHLHQTAAELVQYVRDELARIEKEG